MGLEGIDLPGNQVAGRWSNDRGRAGPGGLRSEWNHRRDHECPLRSRSTCDRRLLYRCDPPAAHCRPETFRPCAVPGHEGEPYLLARVGRLHPGPLWLDRSRVVRDRAAGPLEWTALATHPGRVMWNSSGGLQRFPLWTGRRTRFLAESPVVTHPAG